MLQVGVIGTVVNWLESTFEVFDVAQWVERLLVGGHRHVCLECPETLVVPIRVLMYINCSSDMYLAASWLFGRVVRIGFGVG